MGKGGDGRLGAAPLGCVSLLGLIVSGLSIAILSINNKQLYDVTTWCQYYTYWYAQCYSVSHQCFASQEPLNDATPCNYLYSLGSIGIFFQFWIAIFSCLTMGMAIGCMAGTAFVSTGWWLAGGIYFTDTFKGVASDIPADGWRQGIEGCIWSAFGISVLQFLGLIVAMKTMSGGGHGKPHTEMADVAIAQQAPMYASPPPPNYGYGYGAPPPPAPAYAYPPPTAGYPAAGYPPAPAGAYPPAPAGYPPPPAQ